MELNQYLEIFLDESREHLQALNEKLLLLEQEPSNLDYINEIFRSAHTLKGMAATMGYEQMAALTHEMENVLDLVRNNKRQIDGKMMDTFFHSIDLLEQMVISITEGGRGNIEISQMVTQLQEIASNDFQKNKSIASGKTKHEVHATEIIAFDEYERTIISQSIEANFTIYQISVELDETTILKSARTYMVFHELERYGEVFKTVPTVEELENENFGYTFTLILITNESAEQIKTSILNISEIIRVEINKVTKNHLQLNTKEEIQGTDEEVEHSIPEENEVQDRGMQQTKSHFGKTIRVDIERLDELMNLFSELVIDRGRLEQLANEIKNSQLTDTVEHMSRISSSLQNNILNLRMVPIEQVFNRFPRMVRDLAKDLNKKVNLNIAGEETELDRTVIDEIGDPLVHLLRNAIDHGLESIEERKKAKKNEIGELNLKAYHSGNYVFIEVSEDGRGINRDAVLKKAIQKGLVSQESAKTLSDKQILDFLFSSGFSTAEKISDISGRGVGLDVVKTKIESLGGFVTVESEFGKGTRFTVQLPLTLSIISSMLVKIEEEKFAIPLSSIIETAIYKKEEIMLAHNQEVIDFRGRVVPLVYLKNIFSVPTASVKDEQEISIVLIRKGDKMAGLVVDTFIGQQEIVLKSLGSYLINVFAISGATILGDGQVALIIDSNALIK